jgi:hypothetical protein
MALGECVRLALACKLYKQDKGEYPGTLQELVPDYIPELPDDPFSEGYFIYKRRGDGGFILYSVGPNGVDDGGKGITKKERLESSNKSWRTRDRNTDIGWLEPGEE